MVSRNGTPLALLRVEVLPMYIPFSLRTTVLGLAFGSVAFAQSPVPTPPTPPAVPLGAPAAPLPAPPQFPLITQSSRIRAFNPGPGGEVRNLYLQNGSVVDLAPGLGRATRPRSPQGRKDYRDRHEVRGQRTVSSRSVERSAERSDVFCKRGSRPCRTC